MVLPEIRGMTMRHVTSLLASSITLLAMTLAGCGHMPVVSFSDDGQYLTHHRGPGLVADPESPIPDLPRPIGFVEVPKLCSASVGPDGVRTVQHFYQGRGPVAEIQLFYKYQLRDFGWTVSNVGYTDEGELVITGQKGPESLRIRAVRSGSRTNLIVTIEPA